VDEDRVAVEGDPDDHDERLADEEYGVPKKRATCSVPQHNVSAPNG